MALFEYKAIDASGKTKKGLIEADNPKAARGKIKKQGLLVTEVSEKSAANSSSAKNSISMLFGGVGVADLSLMTRQLSSLIKANIPLVEALNALVEQTENERLKMVLAQIRQDVNEGSSLAKALAAHPKVFDTIYINMVEAGETSGTMSLILLKLAELKESQLRLRDKVRGAMMYPTLMLVASFGLMIGIFT